MGDKIMRFKKVVFLFLIALQAFLTPLTAYASGISLNGDFNDWSDKPLVTDPMDDEQPFRDLIEARWFPDMEEGNLYLYCERVIGEDKKNENGEDEDGWYDEEYENGGVVYDDIYEYVFGNVLNGNRRFNYWLLTAEFSSDLGIGIRRAFICYHPPSRKVHVKLYDENMNYLWSANGRWGEDKNSARRIEFYVPFDQLVGSVESGYQLSLSYTCGTDRLPDNGDIIISTISTFPVGTSVVLALLVIAGLIWVMMKKRQLAKGVR
jgi:hypothetical protein